MGLVLVCLAAITWGTTGTTSALIAQQVTVSPLVVGLWRIVFALPIFWLWHSRNQSTRSNNQPNNLPTKSDYLRLVVMGLCMAGYQVFYFAAVPYAGVAMTAMVGISSSPLIIALLAVVILGEKLTRGLCIALGLGVTGTVLLVAQPDALHQGSSFMLGVALALGAGFSYAVYTILAKTLVNRLDSIAIATYSFTIAALALTPTVALHPNIETWLTILPFLLYLGLITGGIGYGIYMIGLRHTSATTAGIAVLLEPLTAALLGIFVFREPIGWLGILGSILLITGILYAQLNTPSQQSKK